MQRCNCKKSKCLLLYCECFSAGVICIDCNCIKCKNTVQTTTTNLSTSANKKRKRIGCNCRQSKCLKKYCECFSAGNKCGDNCKCEGCNNQSYDDNLLPPIELLSEQDFEPVQEPEPEPDSEPEPEPELVQEPEQIINQLRSIIYETDTYLIPDTTPTQKTNIYLPTEQQYAEIDKSFDVDQFFSKTLLRRTPSPMPQSNITFISQQKVSQPVSTEPTQLNLSNFKLNDKTNINISKISQLM